MSVLKRNSLFLISEEYFNVIDIHFDSEVSLNLYLQRIFYISSFGGLSNGKINVVFDIFNDKWCLVCLLAKLITRIKIGRYCSLVIPFSFALNHEYFEPVNFLCSHSFLEFLQGQFRR